MQASTRRPIDHAILAKQSADMLAAIDGLEQGKSLPQCRVLFQCINMAEVFILHNGGVWRGCDAKKIQLHDPDEVILDSMAALGRMMRSHNENGTPWKIDANTANMLREMTDAFIEICETLPHSEVQKCRNIAHKRALQYKGE